ncbi:MAG: gamma-glutamylcyclotransferase [Alphaproteobacteria bacterium]
MAEAGFRREDFTEERIAEIQRSMDLPVGFEILDRRTREASRAAVLADVQTGQDIWVFGYGSLMWNPAFHFAERVPGSIHGWHRSFCLSMPVGRGSVDRPGLMLALDRGGSCRGFAFRIEPAWVQSETQILWRREMISGGYEPRWVRVKCGGESLRALTFTANRKHTRYVGRLPEGDSVRALATGQGTLGSARDYLHNTVVHLDELGVVDGPLHRLLDLVDSFKHDA